MGLVGQSFLFYTFGKFHLHGTLYISLWEDEHKVYPSCVPLMND